MRKRKLAVLIAFGIFLVGTIFGLIISRIIFFKIFYTDSPALFAYRFNKMPQKEVNMAAKKLDLTDEQKRKFVDILEKNKKSINTILKEIEPKLQDKFDTMEYEIKSILDDKQKLKFEEMIANFKKMGPPR